MIKDIEKDETEPKVIEFNWEKIAVYFSLLVGFVTCMNYIGNIRERIAKLEATEYLRPCDKIEICQRLSKVEAKLEILMKEKI